MARVSQEQVLEAVRDAAVRNGASKAIVFGSFARGSATRHSDVDAVFVENTTARFLDRLDAYIRIIYERTGIPADVFVYHPKEFADMAETPFLRRVLAEGIVVYER